MKEFIYIITWCLAVIISDPCPDCVKTDEFGRITNYGCLALHRHIEYDCGHERIFTVKDSALAFYTRVNEQIENNKWGVDWGFGGIVSSVRIDSAEMYKNHYITNDPNLRIIETDSIVTIIIIDTINN